MKKRSFFHRLITCLMAGVVTAALWLLLGRGQANPLFPKSLIFSLVIISLLIAFILPFIWQYLINKNSVIGEKLYSWLYLIIRGAVAIDVAIFGAKKVFHMQFIVPDSVTKLPLKYLDGETLTWYYFGHSYAFICILSFVQLAGAMLLLFRKTCLLGAIVLFALLINIVLIDIFYQMNAGALTQAVVMTLGTAYLILIDYERLLVFFFKTHSNLQSVMIKTGIKNFARIATMLLVLFYILYSANR